MLPTDGILPESRIDMSALHESMQPMQIALRSAEANPKVANLRQAKQYDANHKGVQFTVGQWVFLSTRNLPTKSGIPREMTYKWIGPFNGS